MPGQKFSERFLRFCLESDTHGVKFAYPEEKDFSPLRRVVWILFLIGSFSFLSYFFYHRVDFFLQYETTTKTAYISSRSDIPFPSIILCPPSEVLIASCLTIDDIVRVDADEYEVLDGIGLRGKLLWSNIVETRNNKTFLRPDAQRFFQSLSANVDVINSESAKDFFKNCDAGLCINVGKGVESGIWKHIVDTLARHDLNTPIKDKEPIDKSELLQRCGPKLEHLHLDGLCNSADDGKLHCPFVAVPSHSGDCATLEGLSGQLRIRTATIRFDPEELQSLLSITASVHHPWKVLIDYGGPSQQQIDLDIEKFQFLDLFIEKVTKVKKMGPPYATCGSSQHMKNPVDGKYSREICVDDCKARCEGANIVNTTTFEENCAANCADNNNFAFHTHKDGCPHVGCDETKYQVGVKTTDTLPKGDVFIINAKFSTSCDMTVYVDVPVYPAESLLAELGGTMGLFVGISLLTVLHCLEFLCTEIICCLAGRTRKSTGVVVGDTINEVEGQGRSVWKEVEVEVEGQGGSCTEEIHGRAILDRVDSVMKSLVEKMTALENKMEGFEQKLHRLQ